MAGGFRGGALPSRLEIRDSFVDRVA